MSPSSPLMRAVFGFLCIAFLMMRIGGEHVHLCLDGGAPPIAVHMTADADAFGSSNSAGKPHHDLDLSLSGEALAKKFDKALGLSILLAFGVLQFTIAAAGGPIIPWDRERPILASAFFHIRPPLRGPPR